jgi:hypothetical protein
LLEIEKLALLVSSYNFHFSEYCKGKRNVTQRIPSKVWKSVYVDFSNKARELAAECGEKFDETNLPAERTLQDSIRCALEDQDTGTPDEMHAENVTLQCEDTMQRLKRSDGHATRNMMRLRQEMIAGKARTNADSSASKATVTLTEKLQPLQNNQMKKLSDGKRDWRCKEDHRRDRSDRELYIGHGTVHDGADEETTTGYAGKDPSCIGKD